MALASELMGLAIVLAMKPFSLMKLACVIGVRIGLVVLRTWLDLTKAAVSLHVSLLWKLILWTVAIAFLPFRILTAIHRERQLETRFRLLRDELEDLIWERKDLEERHSRVVRERKMLEFMLTELEDDYDKTLTRLELLEKELRITKVENLRMKETRGKDVWDFKGRQDERNNSSGGCTSRPDQNVIEEALAILRGLLTQKDAATNNSESLGHLINLLSRSGVTLERSEMSGALPREREAALKRSLFSAMLSLFVGVTIWEAKEPCTPLMAALFTVVTISLASVLQFISTISNKPAFDAVALLSLNWFILGTLSYPVFPGVARFSVSPTGSFAHHVFSWLSSSTRSYPA